jgi:o-succinylbenzoate synthase
LHPYRLPLRRPWRSARGALNARQGWLVIASDGRHSGYGDCAPLPEAGTEPPAQAEARLMHWCEQAKTHCQQQLLDALASDWPSPTPAADAAVETALLDRCARDTGQPLRALLEPRAVPVDRVPVNAALGSLMHCTPNALQAAAEQGFRVCKLKLGTADSATELARLESLLTTLPPQVQVRLDANGAWDLATAHQIVRALDGLAAIESLEEPLRDPGHAELARLQALTTLPLALDESLPRRPWPLYSEPFPLRRIVLKPGVLGGLRPSVELARRALDAGITPVVTSLIESAAGLWASAQLASALCALGCQTHHGLATSDWLTADLGPPPSLVGGGLRLTARPGSGFQPHP